ncbi:MAG: SUMF1/EgtB/PvdO family nonheme iron enzyme [Alphaproteobacteria bacterium]|nr:SUMF1/EgtB/PvdO family nonheme iron enzyme [Alphaproteobacteria bacterium]
MRKPKIFISFASDDRALAREIEIGLVSRKYSVFMSDTDLSPGESVDHKIEEKIRGADGVIFLISKSFLQDGRYTLTELDFARQTWRDPSGHVLSVLIDEVNPGDLPAYLKAVSALEPKGNARAETVSRAAQMWPVRSWPHLAVIIGLPLLAIGAYLAVESWQWWTGPPPGMVKIPGGKFVMGSTSDEVAAAYQLALETEPGLSKDWKWGERPDHDVILDPFFIDIHEVTVADYQQFEKEGAAAIANSQSTEGRYPQTAVTWAQADAYCRQLGKFLPTEAQWEMAARGVERSAYPWGSDPVGGTRANYCDKNCPSTTRDSTQDDGYRLTAPVGSYPAGANPSFQIHDLAGNVAEWVQDWYYRDFYSGRESTDEENRKVNPVNTKQPENTVDKLRVIRGGHYLSGPAEIRAAFRGRIKPDAKLEYVGFRCAMPAP